MHSARRRIRVYCRRLRRGIGDLNGWRCQLRLGPLYSGNSSSSSTALSVANALVAAINADTNQLVTASVTGSTSSSATIALTARASNGSTNFVVSVTGASTVSGFTGPSFSSPGTTLTGATDPATPGAATLSSSITTTYLYDALSDLTRVNQLPQTRTYLYDSLGELTSASVPEANGGVTPQPLPIPPLARCTSAPIRAESRPPTRTMP